MTKLPIEVALLAAATILFGVALIAFILTPSGAHPGWIIRPVLAACVVLAIAAGIANIVDICKGTK